MKESTELDTPLFRYRSLNWDLFFKMKLTNEFILIMQDIFEAISGKSMLHSYTVLYLITNYYENKMKRIDPNELRMIKKVVDDPIAMKKFTDLIDKMCIEIIQK